jgi:hypothetical protein
MQDTGGFYGVGHLTHFSKILQPMVVGYAVLMEANKSSAFTFVRGHAA